MSTMTSAAEESVVKKEADNGGDPHEMVVKPTINLDFLYKASYRELQAMAKAQGVPGNLKTDMLRSILRAKFTGRNEDAIALLKEVKNAKLLRRLEISKKMVKPAFVTKCQSVEKNNNEIKPTVFQYQERFSHAKVREMLRLKVAPVRNVTIQQSTVETHMRAVVAPGNQWGFGRPAATTQTTTNMPSANYQMYCNTSCPSVTQNGNSSATTRPPASVQGATSCQNSGGNPACYPHHNTLVCCEPNLRIGSKSWTRSIVCQQSKVSTGFRTSNNNVQPYNNYQLYNNNVQLYNNQYNNQHYNNVHYNNNHSYIKREHSYNNSVQPYNNPLYSNNMQLYNNNHLYRNNVQLYNNNHHCSNSVQCYNNNLHCNGAQPYNNQPNSQKMYQPRQSSIKPRSTPYQRTQHYGRFSNANSEGMHNTSTHFNKYFAGAQMVNDVPRAGVKTEFQPGFTGSILYNVNNVLTQGIQPVVNSPAAASVGSATVTDVTNVSPDTELDTDLEMLANMAMTKAINESRSQPNHTGLLMIDTSNSTGPSVSKPDHLSFSPKLLLQDIPTWNNFLEQMSNNLSPGYTNRKDFVQCKYGCQMSFSSKVQQEEHETHCLHKSAMCPLPDCTFVSQLCYLPTHVLSAHANNVKSNCSGTYFVDFTDGMCSYDNPFPLFKYWPKRFCFPQLVDGRLFVIKVVGNVGSMESVIYAQYINDCLDFKSDVTLEVVRPDGMPHQFIGEVMPLTYNPLQIVSRKNCLTINMNQGDFGQNMFVLHTKLRNTKKMGITSNAV